MRARSAWPPGAAAVVLVGVLASGCGGSGDRDPAPSDSTVFGDDRVHPDSGSRLDPVVLLLERMVDEYEELDVVMDDLAGPEREAPVRRKAWTGDRHQDDDKDRLLELLQAEYGERYQPRTPLSAARIRDSIAALPKAAGVQALNALVFEHHRAVDSLIADGLPAVGTGRIREALAGLHNRLTDELRKLGPGPASGVGASPVPR